MLGKATEYLLVRSMSRKEARRASSEIRRLKKAPNPSPTQRESASLLELTALRPVVTPAPVTKKFIPWALRKRYSNKIKPAIESYCRCSDRW